MLVNYSSAMMKYDRSEAKDKYCIVEVNATCNMQRTHLSSARSGDLAIFRDYVPGTYLGKRSSKSSVFCIKETSHQAKREQRENKERTKREQRENKEGTKREHSDYEGRMQ